jgi:DNA-binding CsgD family transcriptional regulator/tetratricopeptide (TPR) repeat protein
VSTWVAPRLPAAFAGGNRPLFVGRRDELAELEQIWSSVLDESRQVVFVGGEPGVGKSHLVSEAAAALHAHGAAVLYGACHADFQVSYRPFVTAIEELFDAAAPGALAPVLGESAAQLLRLTPKVRRHCSDLAEAEPAGQDARLALFDALLDLLVALAERQPVVLVVEDLHWATTPTLQLLAHLVRSSARTRLLLLITHRTTVPDRTDELTYAIADLYRHDGVSRIDLDGLETEEIADYLVRSAGMGPATARASAAVLRDQTAGNAFFFHELWREISTKGGVEALRASGFQAPQTVRDTLDRRLAGVADADAEVIETAAVAGETFDLAILLEASDHPRDVVLAAVDLGVGFGLFAAVAEVAGRYRFLHALARQAVLDRLPPSRQVGMHARVGDALERRGTADPGVVTQLAHHFDRAHALGYAGRAVTYLVEAARHAGRSLAHEEAGALYARAADLTGGDAPRRWELLLAAARSRMLAGDFAEARGLFDQLAKADDPDVQLQAAIGYEAASWRPGRHGQRALELLEEALGRRPADPEDAIYVRALASRGRALSFTGDARGAEQVGERGLDLARQIGDDDLVAHALGATLWRGMTPRLAPVLLARAVELAELGRRLGDDDHLGPAGFYRAVFGYMQGAPDEWANARDDLGRAARTGGQPFFRYVAGCETYARQFAQGDFAGASRTVATLGELGAEFGVDTAEGSHGIQVFMLKRATGALEQVRPFITGSEAPDAHWAPGLLALYCELGLWTAASRVLGHLLDRLDVYGASSGTWAGVLAFMADAATRLEDKQAAARLRPLLAEYQGLNLIAGQFVAVFGSADRYLAGLDSLLGKNTADDHLDAALDMDRRMGALTHQVETLSAWSAHAARRGGSQGARRAAQLRAEARVLAERIGHQRALRDLGVDAAPTPAPVLPDGLTAREIEVLQLVADGLSNREIGERLFISQNTAANHIRSILMKTGAANRTRAAIYAADHDLLLGGRT